ncbi:MAG TPA: glycoside hydrolase family 2 TIM barrel-domain containing protein [Pseudacidobacterium sp.]|jgi:beta-galactosidase|nr:glycoside hydrolase family 2 TIM barrel-domain containing protein [Pseudacidobacterium sp.]
MTTSRRDFLKASALTVAAGMFRPTRALALSASAADTQRLTTGWEFVRQSLGGPWEAWHSEGIAVLEQVTLPHCVNDRDACDPDTPYYRGQSWYRTKLALNNPYPNGRTLLHFEGAGQRAEVYVGPTLAGTNDGGYNEFVFDITDAAEKLGNSVPVAVLCDNSRRLNAMPSDVSDFNLYGGLYRPVSLVYVPAVALASVHVAVETEPKGPAQIAVHARLHNPAALGDSLSISIDVFDSQNAQVHQATGELAPWADEKEMTRFTIEHPERWSPGNPVLYQCRVSLKSKYGENSITERFGIRHIAFEDHGPFLLNGKKLFLKGTQRHEDDAQMAAAVPEDVTRREFQMIKEMGANFIRLAHYQQSSLVLDLCDELGLLVWEELPWCRSGIGDDNFKEMGRRLMRTMIDRHFNHPSIVFWGLGNEDDWPDEYPSTDKQAIRDYMQELHELAHKLDSSRMTSFRRCEFASDIPDVYSPSIWAGWYRGSYLEYQKLLEEQKDKIKHFLHIEWGADNHARRHAEDPYRGLTNVPTGQGTGENRFADLRKGGEAHVPRDSDWSETYACDLFDWHLKVQETLPWFAGSAQWIFKDFSTPMRPENPVPRVNQKGLVERDLTKKESYYVFQSYWAEAPMAHIYGHSWPVRWGSEGQVRWVKVYSNCKEVELFLNRQSCGVKERNSQDFPAAGLRWNCKFVPGENTLRAVGRKGAATVTDEIRFQYQIEKWDKPAQLKLVETSRSGDIVTVEAKLLDAQGVLCLDARSRVRFSIAGKCRLIDNLGTSAGSRVLEMYNGRAVISLAINEGSSTISVISDGVNPAFLSI